MPSVEPPEPVGLVDLVDPVGPVGLVGLAEVGLQLAGLAPARSSAVGQELGPLVA